MFFSVGYNMENRESSILVIMGSANVSIMIFPAASTLDAMDVCPASVHIDAANSATKLIPITFIAAARTSLLIPERSAICENADIVCEMGSTRYSIITIPNDKLTRTAKSGLSSFITIINTVAAIARSDTVNMFILYS